MRRYKSEFVHSYKTYSFGYCEYAELEKSDSLAQVYDEGFLPYSGAKNIKKTLYLARSSRINLKDFSLSSENRRIAKKFDDKLTSTITPLDEFDYKDKGFLDFCLEYFAQRHGDVMPRERLISILESGFPLSVVTYKNGNDQVVGYVLEAADEKISHYWFSFYDLDYAYKSLGLWMMIDSARRAKEEGKKYYYIGTVYGEKALYKTNFNSLEFFDGNGWHSDVNLLRKMAHHDEEHVFDHPDRWKEGQELF